MFKVESNCIFSSKLYYIIELSTVNNLETSLTVFLGKVSRDTILEQISFCYWYDRHICIVAMVWFHLMVNDLISTMMTLLIEEDLEEDLESRVTK